MRSALTPVRDQGQRGTCLAFAVTGAHEMSRRSVPIPEDLSAEALYWGCKRTDGNWNDGTSFMSAAVALARWGQPLESVWPYDATRADGVAYMPPSPKGGDDWYTATLRHVGTDPADLRVLLDGGTPVAIGLTLFDTFFTPDAAGHIHGPPVGSQPRGRHAVLAVGHQATQFLIRNFVGWHLGTRRLRMDWRWLCAESCWGRLGHRRR